MIFLSQSTSNILSVILNIVDVLNFRLRVLQTALWDTVQLHLKDMAVPTIHIQTKLFFVSLHSILLIQQVQHGMQNHYRIH